MAVIDKHLPMTFAAGNICEQDSTCGRSMVAAPATAKNVITVGGTESYVPGQIQSPLSITQCNTPGEVRASTNFFAAGFQNVFGESCRGTVDHRFKPEIMAPASMVTSTRSRYQGATPAEDNPALCLTQNDYYTADSGTSFSAPQAAAACVLVDRKRDDAMFSAAMLKAALVGSAVSLKGGLDRYTGLTVGAKPNTVQGFGRLNLETILNDAPVTRFLDEDANHMLTGAGHYAARLFNVVDPTKPVVLVLAWSDPPSTEATGANTMSTAVNGIFFQATTSQGNYMGNIDMGSDEMSHVWNPTPVCNPSGFCGVPDRIQAANSPQIIVLPPGSATSFTAYFTLAVYTPYNTMLGQKYALFASNAVEGAEWHD
jgi:hypothetical protein